MNFSVNPREFQSLKIGTPQEQSKFLFKLTQILGELSSAISAIQVQLSGLNPILKYLGTITTDQTVACNGSFFVYVAFTSSTTQTRTITLNALAQGACVFFLVNVSAGTFTFKCAGTDTNGNAIDATSMNPNNGVITDLTTTGLSATGNVYAWGQLGFFTVSANPRLNLIQA